MKSRIVKPRGISDDTSALAASKKFGRYKDEAEKIIRKYDVKKDGTVQQLKDAFARYLKEKISVHRLVKDISLSADDIARFTLELTEFQEDWDFTERAGAFINALIARSGDEEFTIFTMHLDVPIDNLCRSNTKNVTINGDAGKNMGAAMKKGKVVVNGNVGDNAGGSMKSGEILINGNSEGSPVFPPAISGLFPGAGFSKKSSMSGIGREMKGGKITVKGDVAGDVGVNMTGGKILVEGNTHNSLGPFMTGGMIIVKGNAFNCTIITMGGEIHLYGELHPIKIDENMFNTALNSEGGFVYHKGILIAHSPGNRDAYRRKRRKKKI